METTHFDLGLNTCFSATRCPLPEDKFPLIRDLGVDTIQYSLDALSTDFLKDQGISFARRIRSAAEKSGIRIHSTFTGADAHYQGFLMHSDPGLLTAAREWFRQTIRLAGSIGAKGYGAFFGAMPSHTNRDLKERKKIIRQFIQGIIELTDYAAECGLEFVMVEPMSVRREYPCTLAETKEFLDTTRDRAKIPILLNLDVGHHAMVTADSPEDKDPYQWLERFAPYSPAIHLHQTDLNASRHWAFTGENNQKGIIQPEKFIPAIEKSGAREVLLVIELFHPIYEPQDDLVFEEIVESINYWKGILNHGTSEIHYAR